MDKKFEVFFSGIVQGVGFRYNALKVSASYDVVGTVQNLSDGRVKMVVEGQVETIERFITEVAETTHGRVKQMETNQYPAVGNFEKFKIIG